MRWYEIELLSRSLPYGRWQWTDKRGTAVETLFNHRYSAIATRVNGYRVMAPLTPALNWRASEYFYGDVDVDSHYTPWENRAARRAAEAVLIAWGISPAEALVQ